MCCLLFLSCLFRFSWLHGLCLCYGLYDWCWLMMHDLVEKFKVVKIDNKKHYWFTPPLSSAWRFPTIGIRVGLLVATWSLESRSGVCWQNFWFSLLEWPFMEWLSSLLQISMYGAKMINLSFCLLDLIFGYYYVKFVTRIQLDLKFCGRIHNLYA